MLTEIYIFSKIFIQMQVLEKQKEIHFQHAFYIQLNVDTYFYCNSELFLNKQKDHQVYLFSKI